MDKLKPKENTYYLNEHEGDIIFVKRIFEQDNTDKCEITLIEDPNEFWRYRHDEIDTNLNTKHIEENQTFTCTLKSAFDYDPNITKELPGYNTKLYNAMHK